LTSYTKYEKITSMETENKQKNPLDTMKVTRDHIIALQEALTHTNKKTSAKRASRLYELLKTLKHFDQQRNTLDWSD